MSSVTTAAAAPRTGSETPSSVARENSPHATTASVTSTSTNQHIQLRATINDVDHPPDKTLWLGDLEPWMDDHYMLQVCSLFGWETSAIYMPRPPAAPNATRHPNNAGYCLLIFPTHEKAATVVEQYGLDAMNNSTAQPILLPNSNRPIKLDWLSSTNAKVSIGKDPGPIDNAIEYSIFVGDIAADVTNADLMNVFRNPNLGLRGDFPPRLIAPFLSCCNAKVMVDSVTGISKGYGFVRFTSEADQKRALLEMQGLYCKSRPMRLSTATAKNKAGGADEEHQEPMSVVVRVTPATSGGPLSPKSIDPSKIRSITSAVAEGAASRPSQRGEFHPMMLAKISQLANTMGQHPGYRGGVASVLPPPGLSNSQIQQWLHDNPQARAQLETLLGNGNDPLVPSDPQNTTVFVGGLSPLISEETLRTFFAPFGAIHYVKVPPGKSCGFVQFVKKSDAERAIEALSGFSIAGSKVRLSWGRIPAAQGAAQAAAAAAAAAASGAPQGHPTRPAVSSPSAGNDGPLSSEQALQIVERLVPSLSTPNTAGVGGMGPPSAGLLRGLPQGQIAQRGPMGGAYRDHFGYPSPSINQSPGFMHGGGMPSSPYHPHGRLDYGRNEYYYDVPGNGYGSPMPYGGVNVGGMSAMSPAMNHLPMGAYPTGGPNASVLEDQLFGTYGGASHRLPNSAVRPSGASVYAGNANGYGPIGGGAGYMAGGYGGEYDQDLGGYRSPAAAASFANPTGNSGYGGFSSPGVFGKGPDINDRFIGTRVPYNHMTGGINGFGAAHGLHTATGPAGGGSYDYIEEPSPHFQPTDILRHDSSGLDSYLSKSQSSNKSSSPNSNSNVGSAPVIGSGSSSARSTGAANGVGPVAPPPKANGHVNAHGVPGSRTSTTTAGTINPSMDGMHELAGMFSGLGTGGPGGGMNARAPISPGPASGMSGGSFAAQLRGEPGRY